MGGRPVKDGANSKQGDGQDAGPSSGDARPQQEQEQSQQQEQEAAELRAANERMEFQVASLKEELNKEIEKNSALQTEAARRAQTSLLTTAAAILASAVAAWLLYKRPTRVQFR